MARRRSPEWWAEQRPEAAGKEVERIVEEVFDTLNQRQTFSHHRFPDARAARGALAAQPADSLVVFNGRPIFVEIKGLKEPKRLAKKRVSQLATLKKFRMAGAEAYVLVFQYLLGLWRIVDVSLMDASAASWDVTHYRGFETPEAALASVGIA